MGKNGLVIVLFLLFVIVFGQSDAFNSRKLVTNPDPNSSSNANQNSGSSSPPPPDTISNLAIDKAPKSKDTSIKNLSDLDSSGLNQDVKGSETFANKNCKRDPICNDQGKTIMACVQDLDNGSDNLTLIVQNEQDIDLKVNITFGASMTTFELHAHATEKVNISLSGDKSNKVILNAGNGVCELQISQPSPVNSLSKSNDPKNTSNLKDVDNLADSPAKPKDAKNPADTPAKPKDNPAKSQDSPPKPEDNPAKSQDENDPARSKDVNAPPKSKDVDDLLKSKDVNDLSKSKETNDSLKSKSKSKDVDNSSKSKDVDDPSKSTTISVNTPVSNNFLDQLTFYSQQVTPMHGAYLAFLVALVIAGSWALCSFRKRRTNGEVPYQELEMGPTESSNAVDVETAEGWDQDWDDDDWDEDKAIRSPGGIRISSNGLTSRTTKKDGWDADWDD